MISFQKYSFFLVLVLLPLLLTASKDQCLDTDDWDCGYSPCYGYYWHLKDQKCVPCPEDDFSNCAQCFYTYDQTKKACVDEDGKSEDEDNDQNGVSCSNITAVDKCNECGDYFYDNQTNKCSHCYDAKTESACYFCLEKQFSFSEIFHCLMYAGSDDDQDQDGLNSTDQDQDGLNSTDQDGPNSTDQDQTDTKNGSFIPDLDDSSLDSDDIHNQTNSTSSDADDDNSTDIDDQSNDQLSDDGTNQTQTDNQTSHSTNTTATTNQTSNNNTNNTAETDNQTSHSTNTTAATNQTINNNTNSTATVNQTTDNTTKTTPKNNQTANNNTNKSEDNTGSSNITGNSSEPRSDNSTQKNSADKNATSPSTPATQTNTTNQNLTCLSSTVYDQVSKTCINCSLTTQSLCSLCDGYVYNPTFSSCMQCRYQITKCYGCPLDTDSLCLIGCPKNFYLSDSECFPIEQVNVTLVLDPSNLFTDWNNLDIQQQQKFMVSKLAEIQLSLLKLIGMEQEPYRMTINSISIGSIDVQLTIAPSDTQSSADTLASVQQAISNNQQLSGFTVISSSFATASTIPSVDNGQATPPTSPSPPAFTTSIVMVIVIGVSVLVVTAIFVYLTVMWCRSRGQAKSQRLAEESDKQVKTVDHVKDSQYRLDDFQRGQNNEANRL